jgi:exodeoxyribonuclease VIII
VPISHDFKNTEYHAHPAISKSGLDRIDQSPAHYRAWLESPHETTPALTFGSAAHAYILERKVFDQTYVVMSEKIDRRTKAGKEAWEAFHAEANGREVLTLDDMATLEAMAYSISQHPVAEELLDPGAGNPEVSFFSELSGVNVKCRPDWLRHDGIVVDLKTTDNAGPNAFAKSCAKWRYHVQSAFYSDVLANEEFDVKAFVFIAVEKSAPFAVGVYELDIESLEAGREAYQRNLDTYKRCLESGHWPAYSNSIETLTLPRWAIQQAA